MFLAELGVETASSSRAFLLGRIRKEVSRTRVRKKMKVVLMVDEASLLRLEVFSEIHTLCQFDLDSKPWLPIIFAGQSHLIDKLMYPGSRPWPQGSLPRSILREPTEVKWKATSYII